MIILNQLGQFITRAKAALLGPFPQPADVDSEQSDPFREPVILEISDVIDLHSVQPREVKAVVEEYLFQASLRNFRHVRIIHGKGIGVQREMVRRILSRTHFVISFSDAPLDAGGLGATIAELATNDD